MERVESREDADRALSYYTRQQVVFNDWRLGAAFWTIQVSMAILVIGYVLIWKEGYLDVELAKGAVVTHVAGDAVSVSIGKPGTRYFSPEELTYPGLENGNVFIATRQSVSRQVRGYCEDPDSFCERDDDCGVYGKNGTCTVQGTCKFHSWCNVDEQPEKYDIKVDAVEIWVRSFIQFVRLAPDDIFTTDSNTSEPTRVNTFTVRHLLSMVDPLPVHYEEVAHLGGMFEVGIRWECNLLKQSACKPVSSIRRLDTLFDPESIGYNFSYSEYVDDNHRLKYDVSGIRFLFRTSGVGKKVSPAIAVTTLSTSATLVSLAIVVADLMLTKVFKDRKKFIARKFEKSPDFTDFMAKKEANRKEAVNISDVEKAEQAVVDRERAWMTRFLEHV